MQRSSVYVLEMVYHGMHHQVARQLECQTCSLYPDNSLQKTRFGGHRTGRTILSILNYADLDLRCLSNIAAYLGDIVMLRLLWNSKWFPLQDTEVSEYAAKNNQSKTLKFLTDDLGIRLTPSVVGIAEDREHHNIVEWILLDRQQLHKEFLIHTFYYTEYAVANGRLRILQELYDRDDCPPWPPNVLCELSPKTTCEVILFLWEKNAFSFDSPVPQPKQNFPPCSTAETFLDSWWREKGRKRQQTILNLNEVYFPWNDTRDDPTRMVDLFRDQLASLLCIESF